MQIACANKLSVAILTQHVSHYHAARFRGVAKEFARTIVISASCDADFREFLAKDLSGFDTISLYSSKQYYLQAVADGKVWKTVFEALSAADPDVVAVPGWAFPESLVAIFWARQMGRTVVMMSESQEHDSHRSFGREIVKSRIVKMCHSALVGGASQSAYMHKLGMPAERIFEGYTVVDVDYFEQSSDKARAGEDALRIAYAIPRRYLLASARFIPKKNLPRLIAAFRSALESVSTDHHLVILGDGPEMPAVLNAIRVAGLEKRVQLHGFQPYEKLPIYHGLSEGFVHVSLVEQWGLVISEAAASALPLIVSRPCGAAELINEGRNGFIVDPEDINSISEALAKVMQSSTEVRNKMGLRSRGIAAEWGPNRFAKSLATAADVGLRVQPKNLSTIDYFILKLLSRRFMSTVS